MLKSILSYIQVIHVGIIIYITLELYQYPQAQFNLNLSIAQIVLTAIDVFIIRRSLDIIPLLISSSLFSSLIPNSQIETDWISILFLAKIIYVNDILADAKRLLFSGDNCSFCQLGGIIYNFVRFTLVQYMFLGIVIMIYKAVVLNFDKSVQELPENYVLFYQMMVTATTIGYGDVCPKSRIQMNFFTCAIPFVIGSFIIYANNHVNPLWDEFVSFLNSQQLNKSSKSVINVNSMTQSQKNSLNEFAQLSTQKTREYENLKLTYFNDWISLAAINFEKQAELIHTIVDVTISKEEKLNIVSKVRQQYFPNEWIILDSNDISEDLFMISQGQIDINGETRSTGFIFNQKGFFNRETSGDKIVTKSFVTVWAISMKELNELIINYPSIQEKINTNIAANSS